MDSGVFDQVLQTFLQTIGQGFGRVTPDAQRLLVLLATLEIATAALWWLFAVEDALVGLLTRLLRIGLFAFLLLEMATLTRVLTESFMLVGLQAGGSSVSLEQFQRPSTLIDQGFRLAKPFFTFALSLSGWEVVSNLLPLAFMFGAGVLIWGAFFLVALQVMLTLMEVYVGAVLSVILLPTGVNRYTAFLAERALGWWVGGGIRLMVAACLVSLAFPWMSSLVPPEEPTLVQALVVVGASVLLAVLAWWVPLLATGLVNGGLALHGGAVLGGVLSVGALGAYGIQRGLSASRSLVHGAQDTVQQTRQLLSRRPPAPPGGP